MSTAQDPHSDELAAPARGLIGEERGRDTSAAETEGEAKPGTLRRMFASMSPRFLWSVAEGNPPVLKQFVQFCLVLIYPAWVFMLLVSALVYAVVYGVLWVVLWPARAWMKRNRPEEYAASQLK